MMRFLQHRPCELLYTLCVLIYVSYYRTSHTHGLWVCVPVRCQGRPPLLHCPALCLFRVSSRVTSHPVRRPPINRFCTAILHQDCACGWRYRVAGSAPWPSSLPPSSSPPSCSLSYRYGYFVGCLKSTLCRSMLFGCLRSQCNCLTRSPDVSDLTSFVVKIITLFRGVFVCPGVC